MKQLVSNFRIHKRNYIYIFLICVSISVISFITRPHDCKTTYGPAPYYYNTDLTLWIDLAEEPIDNLGSSILANRPLFAYMGWLFSQPIGSIIGDTEVISTTRSETIRSVPLATIAGLLLANAFCYLLTGVYLYRFTLELFNKTQIALLTAFLWITSSFAFAWSYHPVNQMAGLVVIFAFPYYLWMITKKPTLLGNLGFGIGIGFLMLSKAYYVLPFIYVIWALYNHFDWKTILVTFILFFIPTLIWQKIYYQLAGVEFIDYHLGEEGMIGLLIQKLTNVKELFSDLLRSMLYLPMLILKSIGPIITFGAIGFYIFKGKKYRSFALLGGFWLILFWLFLTLAGFFIPRHGSDLFPFIYPAAAYINYLVWNKYPSIKARTIFITLFILFTIVSYSSGYICWSEIL